MRLFGRRYSGGARELKGKELLKKKTYRLASQLPPIAEDDRRVLAKACLDSGATAGRRQLTALAQAKIAYVREVFDVCGRFRCKAFASIVHRAAPVTGSAHYLRKDYAYLFERFFYCLEDGNPLDMGVVVFDELEKSRSHLLLEQMDRYFRRTTKGRQRAGRIVPEPFFVHSDLTTGVQLADLVAYVLSWGFRTRDMTEPARPELRDLAESVCQLRCRAIREVEGNPSFIIWSFAVIPDLRARDDR